MSSKATVDPTALYTNENCIVDAGPVINNFVSAIRAETIVRVICDQFVQSVYHFTNYYFALIITNDTLEHQPRYQRNSLNSRHCFFRNPGRSHSVKKVLA